MQIKRFEAADMTEALRMVKREFGDDAVILSAKAVRTGGLFNALRKKQVEITAAKDHPEDRDDPDRGPVGNYAQRHDRRNDAFSDLLLDRLAAEPAADRVCLSSSASRPAVPDRPFSTDAPAQASEPPRASVAAVAEDAAPDCGANPVSLKVKLPSRYDHWVSAPFYRHANQRQTIALVGRCGAGKSTAVAKLACYCHVTAKRRLGLISLDRFRIGANAMLARVAKLIDQPLVIVRDVRQMQTALNDLTHVDVVLIDTPGIGPIDQEVHDDVRRMLAVAKPDEIHLVVNATVREDVFDATVDAFSGLGADRLLPTHLDEVASLGARRDLLKAGPLPCAFYCDGIDLFNDLHATCSDRITLAGSALAKPDAEPVTALNYRSQPERAVRPTVRSGSAGVHFVANRNSEMVHHPSCKSVRLINSENIAVFDHIDAARAAGFKPCRACCEVGTFKRTAARDDSHSRVRAI
jgi:flagellar biosynthesis GTPase FlhF